MAAIFKEHVENSVVIYAPTGKDARLISKILEKIGIASVICVSAAEVMDQFKLGAGAFLIAEEALSKDLLKLLTHFLNQQPTWSDLPILVMSHTSLESPGTLKAYSQLGNVTLLERPLRSFTLSSAVKVALRARLRQYAMRDVDKRKDEFLAMLAHELRNPLAPISAASDLLKLTNLPRDKIKQTSEVISRQVKHMTGLIDDLLDLSRVSRGLVTLDNELLDAKQIVANAVEQVRPLIDERRHTLTLSNSPESAYVMGDQKRLVQILSNVLNNAAKYTPEGGQILLSMDVADADVIFTVSDNGIGMPPEVIGNIFEMFAQAERTSDRSQGGLGIGLALVKNLIELHNGQITAHSNGPGMGSKFQMIFPRHDHKEGEIIAPVAVSQQSVSEFRLLVVDDNVDAAEMLSIVLEIAGFQTHVVHSASAALEVAASSEQIDACLLDIGLPDMDGNELAKKLRTMPLTSNTLLIALTGYGQAADRMRTREAGFDYHFVKPVDMEKLLEALSTMQ